MKRNMSQDIQTSCVNPLNLHNSTIKKSLRVVNDLDDAKSLNIKPGQKLCPTCLKRAKEIKDKSDTENSEETEDQESSVT